MIRYNEWKLLQESAFSLGIKTPPTVGGPIGGTGIQEGGFNFGKDDEDDDDEEEDFDDEGLGDEDGLDDDEEGGPPETFPPTDSEDLGGGGDDMDFDADQFDLAGLGDDHSSFGSMGAGKAGGDDLGIGGDLGGDDLGTDLGGDDLGIGGDLGGDDLGADLGGDDLGLGGDDMGEPCPDCNPDGAADPDPECQTCGGEGFLSDEDGLDGIDGIDGGGEIGADEIGKDIDKMNFMSKMTNYQKKYMGAGQSPMQQAPQMGQQSQMNPQQMQQMQQQLRQQQQMLQQQQQNPQKMMQKKFMSTGQSTSDERAEQSKKFKNMTMADHEKSAADLGKMNNRKMCGTCENVAGTYGETQEDFFKSLTNNAKGEERKRFYSGISEDSLLQSVDPNYQVSQNEPGQVGFAPQAKLGSIGGGYTQEDIKDIPVLGETKYPTLDQYKKSKKR